MLGIGGWMTTIGPWYRDLRKPGLESAELDLRVILGLAAWSGVLAWTKAS
jgi:benzodiazapine receptor